MDGKNRRMAGRKGYSSLDEIRGAALPNILKTAEVARQPEAFMQRSTLKNAPVAACKRSCFYEAITTDESRGSDKQK
jgi:dihydropyrimidine dehydrogenase (NAD+) subunit PreA